MNKQKAEEITKEVQEITDKHEVITGRGVEIITQKDSSDGDYEVKVFERNSDGTISGGLLNIKEYVSLSEKFGTNIFVRVEWRDGKGTKGAPYFSFFS